VIETTSKLAINRRVLFILVVSRLWLKANASLTSGTMSDHLASGVLRFWFGAGEEYGRRHKRWFEKDASFDAEVSKRFLPLFEELVAGARREWLEPRADCLARIIALDQFPRHIFRGSPRAFAADALALEAARHAIAREYDRSMLPVERMFAYLPFEHSESLEDQLKACELTAPLAAFPQTEDAPRHALRHRDVIRRFGRFPHRNVALGRASTPEEIEFLKQPGSRF
jgi:uncharacterized protein (DUF924 family)